MSVARPSFLDSPYFYYDESGNMRLRDGAPVEVVKEFEEFIEGTDEYNVPDFPAKALTEEDLKDL
jgi:hypothetical protein